MDYQEAIKYFGFKIDKYKRIASQRNRFDQSIDNSGLEKEIEFFETAISAMEELQEYKERIEKIKHSEVIQFRAKLPDGRICHFGDFIKFLEEGDVE